MENQQDQPTGSFRSLMRLYRGWRSVRDRFASALDVDFNRKVEIYTQLSTSATLLDIVYWLQLFFSAGIATLGLVLNSTAVVIGAMLISPLMAPILSQGLALSTGDLTLGLRSLANLILSTLVGGGVALVLVALLPFNDITPEIRARMEPNTLDLVIALFSGAIGSIAICRDVKGIATSIPGVAIAVALMPPLCVIGFGLGYAVSIEPGKGWEIATGGGLLYLTNLVAITFTAMIVFILLRIDTNKVRERVREWRDGDPESQWWLSLFSRIPTLEKAREVRSFPLRLLMILLPMLVIVIPLSSSLSKMGAKFAQQQRDNATRQVAIQIWDERYAKDTEGNTRSYLDELNITESDGVLQVFLRVFDNKPYSAQERREYIRLLANSLDRKPETVSLQLIEIPTSERNVGSPVVEATPEPITVASGQAKYLKQITDSLAGFRLPPPASYVGFNSVIRSDGTSILVVFYVSTREIHPDGEAKLKDEIRQRLGLPNVELVITRIDSEPVSVTFDDENRVSDDDAKLLGIARTMREHQKLSLRVQLVRTDGDEENNQKRRESITKYFVDSGAVAANRIVIGDATGEDASDTCQLFVRN